MLVTQRDEGVAGWLDTRISDSPIMTLLERRLTNVEADIVRLQTDCGKRMRKCCIFKFKQVDVGNILFRFVVECLMRR